MKKDFRHVRQIRHDARFAVVIFALSLVWLMALEARAELPDTSKINSRPSEKCAGCSATGAIETKIRLAYDKPELEQIKLLREAARLVSEMPKTEDGRWEQKQIQRITQLLRVTTKIDKMLIVIDTNALAFATNQKAFLDEFKRLPNDEANALRQDLNAVMSEWKHGNDPELTRSPPAPIEKPATSKPRSKASNSANRPTPSAR